MQCGITPAHAVTIGPVDPATATLMNLFDGTRGVPLLQEESRRLGLPEEHLDRLLTRLSAAGLLDDATGGGPAADALRKQPAVLQRLRPDLTSLSLADRSPGGGLRRAAARRTMSVQVRGAGRVGALIAATLSAAGVGSVDVMDGGQVEPSDVSPGGLPPESIGERRDVAARRLVRRCAPGGPRAGPAPGEWPTSRHGPPVPQPGFALVVLAPREGLTAYAPDPAAAAELMAAGTPHLYAGVLEATGMVGPLVLPGGTACAGCLDLGRADQDRGWPRMLAQWRSGRRTPVQACDLGLATAVAGTAAAHVLATLDGGCPSSTGVRWEAPLPGIDWRPRHVPPHSDCTCGAARTNEREDTSASGPPHETMAE
ncbi:ThiF family protein [Streptomyces sp. YIM 130001]|uniref:ThiF family adenylyltransferase n=1 Tax=Streptomyces sp. YIM 130001 TaxID=2259644 RepID=UPI000EE11531|nr:ThiF family adenylyltransferase [Streptomyces sp. YIM 130001]RII16121.1 ThiF family protein [Streptomyces sp. YIM 130001]